jgi:hypothetical protein
MLVDNMIYVIDKPCRYLVVGNALLEIQRVLQEPTSWFIGQSVESDGALHVATRIDPLYLALPLLYRARNQVGSFSFATTILP